MDYLVVYEKSKNGWGAFVPDLPGLGVVGDSISEVRRLIKLGIPLHLKSLREDGLEIPKPTAKSDRIQVARHSLRGQSIVRKEVRRAKKTNRSRSVTRQVG